MREVPGSIPGAALSLQAARSAQERRKRCPYVVLSLWGSQPTRRSSVAPNCQTRSHGQGHRLKLPNYLAVSGLDTQGWLDTGLVLSNARLIYRVPADNDAVGNRVTKSTPCGTRTRNLRIRSPTPCPLGQGGCRAARNHDNQVSHIHA